jgi:hypothetical protein
MSHMDILRRRKLIDSLLTSGFNTVERISWHCVKAFRGTECKIIDEHLFPDISTGAPAYVGDL